MTRRRKLGEGLVAAEAAFRVGFESPSLFSREFRRMFGAPPRQDVAALQIEVPPATSSGFYLLVSVR
jgi:AraC-like DNA-binding protein